MSINWWVCLFDMQNIIYHSQTPLNLLVIVISVSDTNSVLFILMSGWTICWMSNQYDCF